MKKLRAVISIVYLATQIINIVCLPLSAIFLIFRLCGASAMSWIGCFIPVIIVLAILPITIIAKLLLDEKVR